MTQRKKKPCTCPSVTRDIDFTFLMSFKSVYLDAPPPRTHSRPKPCLVLILLLYVDVFALIFLILLIYISLSLYFFGQTSQCVFPRIYKESTHDILSQSPANWTHYIFLKNLHFFSSLSLAHLSMLRPPWKPPTSTAAASLPDLPPTILHIAGSYLYKNIIWLCLQPNLKHFSEFQLCTHRKKVNL